jgi:hypothetical protein
MNKGQNNDNRKSKDEKSSISNELNCHITRVKQIAEAPFDADAKLIHEQLRIGEHDAQTIETR